MMRKNQKGQALIEFVLILPVIILLIFGFIDLGRIVVENSRWESVTTMVITKYKETKNYNEVIKYIEDAGYTNIDISIKREDNLLKVTLNKKISIMTPGLDEIIGDPYSVSVERVVNYE